eukprot:403336246
MSIKITQQQPLGNAFANRTSSNSAPDQQSQPFFGNSGQISGYGGGEDILMMTPSTKRYRGNDSAMSSAFGSKRHGGNDDSACYLTNEVFLPTEMDKLKKLFPLLDNNQIQQVLEECNNDCSKTLKKFMTDKYQQASEKDSISKSLISKRIVAHTNPSQDQSAVQNYLNQVRASKKRRRDDQEELMITGQAMNNNSQASSQFNQTLSAYQQQYSSQGLSQNSFSHLQTNSFSHLQSNQQNNFSHLQQTSQQQNSSMHQQRLQTSTTSQINTSTSQNLMQVQQQQQQQIEQRQIEELFAENTVKELMNVQSPDDAYKIVGTMLKQFKQEIVKKQVDLLSGILRDNKILKKGVAIQNQRSQEAIQKASQYDEVVEIAKKQAEEIGFLKSENLHLNNSLMRTQYNPSMRYSYQSNNNNHFGGGDPSVL